MPAIFCNGKYYSGPEGPEGPAGSSINDIVINDDHSLSIFLTDGRTIQTPAFDILPNVNESDAGKFLMVNEFGQWEPISIENGNEAVY